MDFKSIHQQNSNYLFSLEPQEHNKCTPDDCWCSHYDNPNDNYFYSHILNPAEQYFWWIQEWKKQFKEIHEDCKRLGSSSYSNDYVQGVLDSTPPYRDINRIEEEDCSLFELDRKIDDEIKQWMTAYRD